jgi:hypothetical protein
MTGQARRQRVNRRAMLRSKADEAAAAGRDKRNGRGFARIAGGKTRSFGADRAIAAGDGGFMADDVWLDACGLVAGRQAMRFFFK